MGIRRIENTDPAFEQFLKLPELIDAASRWLVEQGGCTAVRGPCSPLPDFFNLGILVEGFDQPQVTGEAYNPAYYPALIEGCGFEKAADYLSFRNHFPDNQVFEKMMNRLERILGKHKRTSVRSFDVKNFDRDAAIVNDVINRSFESGVFYSITDLETRKFMLKRTAPLNEMEWFMIQEERGEPVGVNLEAPNYDELLWGDVIRGVRSENFAVLPEYHGTFAASSLFYNGWEKARRLGFEDLYISYVSEKHTAMHGIVQSFGCKVTKRHRVYCKQL